ncbi:MAG TPA: M23 family metallopeptidase [Candidatus Angelobacter sp.]
MPEAVSGFYELRPRRSDPAEVWLIVLAAVFLVAQEKQAARYLLPFPIGAKVYVLQGNNGPWGHTKEIAYAYDFKMPIGSDVCAARSGAVVKTETRFIDGNRTPGQENFIFIDHGDRTFSRYYHLTKDGVLVKVGDHVQAGDKIGRSGNTGASAGPHLHFDVTEKCPEWGCQTIPVEFSNAAQNPLQADKEYQALPPGK